MKLKQLQEARYAFPNYANWVQDAINSEERESVLHLELRDVEVALKQISRKYGQPSHEDQPGLGRDSDYYLWQNDVNEHVSYDVVLWVVGELNVHVYKKETDVD